MALTKIPRGLLDTGIADSSDATAITIDSSENATFAGDVLVNKHLRLRTTDDQTNQWYLYTHTDDTLRVNYNGAGNDEIVVNTSGQVGIGTTSPGTLLHLYNSSNAQMTFQNSTTGTTVGSDGYDITLQGSDIYHILRDSGNQRFYTAGTERIRIDSAGKVAIGAVAPNNILDISFADGSNVTAGNVNDNSVTGIVLRNSTDSNGGGTMLKMASANGDNMTAIGHEQKASDSADMVFFTESSGAFSEKMRIKNNGHVGLNSDNPYSQFEIVSTSTAAYSTSSFLASAQIGIKMPDNNGGYAGIRFTNVGGNYEGFIGFTQTTASPSTKAAFVVQGYNRDATAYQEKLRITDGGEVSTPKNPLFVCSGSGGWTAISGVNYLDGNGFWTVDYDRGGNFTNSNGRFTAPVTGFYLFVFHSYTRANDTSGYVYPNFYVENSLWSKGGANTNIQHYVGHGDADKGTCQTAHIYLTANQYVRVGYSAHGNTGSISYHGASLGFTGHLIG